MVLETELMNNEENQQNSLNQDGEAINNLTESIELGSIIENENIENMVNKRNILIVGITGSGKSTLANALVNEVDESGKLKEIFKESAGGTSETENFKKSNFE